MNDRPVHAISDVEMKHWKDFCLDLFGRIIDARLAGKIVTADVQPDYVVPKIDGNLIGVPTGLVHVHLVI